jgi:folate-binding protein YgfZ
LEEFMSASPTIAPLPSRGVLALRGPEARTFLQGIITNNVGRVQGAKAIYSALLTPQGKLLYDFFVVEHDGALLLDCHLETLPAFLQRLTMYRLRAQVEIADATADWRVVAAWNDAPNLPGIVYADPRLPALGRRALVPANEDVPATAGEEDYEAWRLALGVPKVPLDAGPDQTFMMEANFDELNGIDFEKGCYIGQELASRMKRRDGLRKRLLPVDLDGPLPPPETPVLAGERNVGTLRTGMGRRAIAYLRIDRLEEEAGVPLTAGGISLTVDWPDWIPR